MTAAVACTIEDQFGPVRDQGPRPTCLAFALSALNQHTSSAPGYLSVEYLYRQALSGGACTDGLTLDRGLASVSKGQPEEHEAPYETAEPVLPVTVPVLPAATTLYSAALNQHALDLAAIERTLRAGQPVGLGIRVTRSFTQPSNGVIAFEADVFPGAAHAVVVVGLGTIGSDCHLRIRNSWGPQWGDAGHAWLPWSYVQLHTLCVYGETSWLS